jgi:hypothetical protein
MVELNERMNNEFVMPQKREPKPERKQHPELERTEKKHQYSMKSHRELSYPQKKQKSGELLQSRINRIREAIASGWKEQRDLSEKWGLSPVAREYYVLSGEKPLTLMERFNSKIKTIKEWLTQRRRARLQARTVIIQQQYQQKIPDRLIPLQGEKAIPHYIFSQQHKKSLADKVTDGITVIIEYILKFISKAVKVAFSSRKRANASAQFARPQ